MMQLSALWLVGFRPFFILAIASGALLPILWVLIFSGDIAQTGGFIRLALPTINWHAHEMFYGFGWALLGGFLLTASKNWVNIRGYHGAVLVVLATLWMIERLVMIVGGGLPEPVVSSLAMLFMSTMVGLLVYTLVKHREQDSYADNVYFIIGLPLFLPAKWLMFQEGMAELSIVMTLGLFRLCFLIMLERTLQPFMKGAFGITLKRVGWVDHGIKVLGLLLVFTPWLPETLLLIASISLAVLLLTRWFYWHPFKALTRLDVGVMYLGYLAIALQLVFVPFAQPDIPLIGTFSIHLFTLGAIGLIAPAMIIRISRGHTGRKVQFDGLDKSAISFMLLGFFCRLIGPQLIPDWYLLWLWGTAFCWLLCFTLIGMRYVPWLLRPRMDGKVH